MNEIGNCDNGVTADQQIRSVGMRLAGFTVSSAGDTKTWVRDSKAVKIMKFFSVLLARGIPYFHALLALFQS